MIFFSPNMYNEEMKDEEIDKRLCEILMWFKLRIINIHFKKKRLQFQRIIMEGKGKKLIELKKKKKKKRCNLNKKKKRLKSGHINDVRLIYIQLYNQQSLRTIMRMK